jgi:ribosome biogenesis protein BRX1
MQDFEKIIEFIFKKKHVTTNSFIIVYGFIPKRFRNFLINIKTLNPLCKLIHCSKKEDFSDIEEIINNLDSTILVASHNKRKNMSKISLKYNRKKQSIKFSVLNSTHCSSGFFFGNSDEWSRPLLIFDSFFEKRPELKTFKILISSFLNSKVNDLKISPFYDHVIAFYYLNSKIVLRVYQISIKKSKNLKDEFSLIEIGPRLKIRIDNHKI